MVSIYYFYIANLERVFVIQAKTQKTAKNLLHRRLTVFFRDPDLIKHYLENSEFLARTPLKKVPGILTEFRLGARESANGDLLPRIYKRK